SLPFVALQTVHVCLQRLQDAAGSLHTHTHTHTRTCTCTHTHTRTHIHTHTRTHTYTHTHTHAHMHAHTCMHTHTHTHAHTHIEWERALLPLCPSVLCSLPPTPSQPCGHAQSSVQVIIHSFISQSIHH